MTTRARAVPPEVAGGMRLEQPKEPGWAGATGAVVCKRCGKQSAAVLAKSQDYKWSKPT